MSFVLFSYYQEDFKLSVLWASLGNHGDKLNFLRSHQTFFVKRGSESSGAGAPSLISALS